MEQKDFQWENSIPTLEQIDWAAIAYLQGQTSKCQCEFRREAYDKSIDKVLAAPKRKATDTKLAEELFKDSKRELSRRNDESSRIGKAILDYNYQQEQMSPAVEFELPSKKKSLKSIIENGLNSLSKSERLSLYIKATKAFHLVDVLLHVTVRQYRNILNRAQQKLHEYPGFKEAFFLVFLDTDFEDYDSFLQTYLSNNNSSVITKSV